MTTLSPKGLLNAIQYTTFLCPSRVKTSSPRFESQILHVLSYDPVINLSPFLLNAQLVKGSTWAFNVLYNEND